jgi:hypothetical protein
MASNSVVVETLTQDPHSKVSQYGQDEENTAEHICAAPGNQRGRERERDGSTAIF